MIQNSAQRLSALIIVDLPAEVLPTGRIVHRLRMFLRLDGFPEAVEHQQTT